MRDTGHRHPGGPPGRHLRELHADRGGEQPSTRRHRARAGDLPEPGRPDGRADRRGEPPGRGEHLLVRGGPRQGGRRGGPAGRPGSTGSASSSSTTWRRTARSSARRCSPGGAGPRWPPRAPRPWPGCWRAPTTTRSGSSSSTRNMPGMDGEQTARAIKAAPRYAEVPLVLLGSRPAPPDGGGRGRPLGRPDDEAGPPLAALQRPLPGRRGPRVAPRPGPGRRPRRDEADLAPPHPPGRGQRGQSPGGDRHGRAARLRGRGRLATAGRRSRRSTTADTT